MILPRLLINFLSIIVYQGVLITYLHPRWHNYKELIRDSEISFRARCKEDLLDIVMTPQNILNIK